MFEGSTRRMHWCCVTSCTSPQCPQNLRPFTSCSVIRRNKAPSHSSLLHGACIALVGSSSCSNTYKRLAAARWQYDSSRRSAHPLPNPSVSRPGRGLRRSHCGCTIAWRRGRLIDAQGLKRDCPVRILILSLLGTSLLSSSLCPYAPGYPGFPAEESKTVKITMNHQFSVTGAGRKSERKSTWP